MNLSRALHHYKGMPIVPAYTSNSTHYGNNQVRMRDTTPPADLLQCVEAVLDEHSGTSPYLLWKRLMAAPAIKHGAAGEYSATVEIDLMALAEQLNPAPALA
jgi:hypothetical protein